MSKRLQELEYFAQKFRDDNSLSEKEPIRIKSILQKNNILTVYKPLSSGLSGMSIKIKSETKVASAILAIFTGVIILKSTQMRLLRL